MKNMSAIILMKRTAVISACVMFALFCSFNAQAKTSDAELKVKVDAFYKEWNQAVEAKNIDAIKGLLEDDYKLIGGMAGKDHQEKALGLLFKEYEQLSSSAVINTIKATYDDDGSGEKVQVIGDYHLKAKKKGDANWSTVVHDGFFEILKPNEDGEFKLLASGNVNLERFKNIKDNVYTDPTLGYSIAGPEGWSLLPLEMPTMQGGTLFMMPNGHTPGMFGYVELPYQVTAKQAVEGDGAVMKKVTKSYKLLESGPVERNGMKGYGSLSRFEVKESDEVMMRRRVYLSGGGLLYVFLVTAPEQHWDEVKGSLDTILDSFKQTDKAKNNAASIVREKTASGEIMGRIYSNDEYGCQIAAPKGWELKATPLGAFKVSISITPPDGKSLVRLLGLDMKVPTDVKDVFQQEMNGIKSITEDFSVQVEPEEIEIAGVTGMTGTFTFSLEGLGTMTRKSVMVTHGSHLFMILCDAIPPEKFAELEASFDSIIKSFTVN